MLIEDMRKVFRQASDPPHMPTSLDESHLFDENVPRILPALTQMEDRPWAEYTRNSRPLTSSGLAKLLKRFDIKPTTIRVNSHLTAKGYRFVDFVKLWDSYGINDQKTDTDPTG